MWGGGGGGAVKLAGKKVHPAGAGIQSSGKKGAGKKSGLSEFETQVSEAFSLLFRDKFSGFPLLMQNIFNGKIQKNMETEDFLNS
jgi:hypothetical protein